MRSNLMVSIKHWLCERPFPLSLSHSLLLSPFILCSVLPSLNSSHQTEQINFPHCSTSNIISNFQPKNIDSVKCQAMNRLTNSSKHFLDYFWLDKSDQTLNVQRCRCSPDSRIKSQGGWRTKQVQGHLQRVRTRMPRWHRKTGPRWWVKNAMSEENR